MYKSFIMVKTFGILWNQKQLPFSLWNLEKQQIPNPLKRMEMKLPMQPNNKVKEAIVLRQQSEQPTDFLSKFIIEIFHNFYVKPWRINFNFQRW